MVGLADDDDDWKVIQREFARVATDTVGDAVSDARPALQMAKHFQVFIFSSLGPDGARFVVGRYCLESITGPCQRDELGEVVDALGSMGFVVGSCSADSAAENQSVWRLMTAGDRGISANDFLSDDVIMWCKERGIDTDVVVAVQFTGSGSPPMFWIPDPPHLWKKIVNALANSSKPTNSARNLEYPKKKKRRMTVRKKAVAMKPQAN